MHPVGQLFGGLESNLGEFDGVRGRTPSACQQPACYDFTITDGAWEGMEEGDRLWTEQVLKEGKGSTPARTRRSSASPLTRRRRRRRRCRRCRPRRAAPMPPPAAAEPVAAAADGAVAAVAAVATADPPYSPAPGPPPPGAPRIAAAAAHRPADAAAVAAVAPCGQFEAGGRVEARPAGDVRRERRRREVRSRTCS